MPFQIGWFSDHAAPGTSESRNERETTPEPVRGR
jgi:hypothetical protein